MASLLNTLCKPCYSSFFECSVIFFAENYQERVFTNTFFRTNSDISKHFFFNINLSLSKFPHLLTKRNRFHQLLIVGLVRPASLYSRSIKRAMHHDQISPELEHSSPFKKYTCTWLNHFFAGYWIHVKVAHSISKHYICI